MSQVLYTRDIDFTQTKSAVEAILEQIDKGDFDEELAQAGVPRNRSLLLAPAATISEDGQGLSPDQWAQIVVEFVPVAAAIVGSIWEIIVVPALKRRFRDDKISATDPQKKSKK